MKRLVEVHYFVKSGCRDEFYRQINDKGIAAAARAETGNEKYDFFFSPTDPDELVLFEMWSSPEAVQSHMETAHYRELMELKKELVIETTFSRYDAEQI
ncbi:MAG: antibiotic biosynthesis monooxygenase [Ruminiclostridium sp.]|nr:antibiotic biosynthesis monooxygenase [Ruminiclostridium sp.]